ncbi:glycosyl hydrolase [Rathayibacter sp. KR2-224]|uniref:glycosyl hydrolase n=1 Tax=Rathayibacter sp. KR2-224 TaxID=3400913 RepID=UPI003C00FE82
MTSERSSDETGQGRVGDVSAGDASLFEGFRSPPPEARPMMRWWWFGPDVDRDELERELVAMRDAGIGGAELAFVYPLSEVRHPFLSQRCLDDVTFAARKAHELGLRFDLTVGSGWSYGGPHITEHTAARALQWDVRDIGAQATEVRLGSRHPGDAFVAAFVGDGTLQELPEEFDAVDATHLDATSERLRIPAGGGPRVLAIAWSVLTGQQVKRAAAGAEGPVLDHYSAEATAAHLSAVADPLLEAASAELVGSVFCDSLEVYGANWTPDLPGEFRRRRGADPTPELWRLRFESPGSDAFRAAFYQTLGELYEENFLDVVRAWANTRGVPFRVQSYGSPPARLGSYAHADLVEGEGWGWRGVPQTRWASSSAHHAGRTIVSAEAWTWVHSPSFRATPLDLKGEAHEHFLLGINQLIGHGWPYSPHDAPGLGWFFYASGALDDRNAWWPAMPALTGYLARLSWLLRQGRPVRDVLLYLPSLDVYPRLGPERGGSLDLWRQLRDAIGSQIPAAIRDAGFDFDLVDDDALADMTLDERSIVVLPFVDRMPERTLAHLRAGQESGALVLDVEGAAAAPEFTPTTASALSSELRHLREPDLVMEPHSPSVGFVHRALDDGDLYLLVNTGPEARTFEARPRALRRGWQLWSSEAAVVVGAGGAGSPITVRLDAYQAVVLVTDGARASGSAPTVVDRHGGEELSAGLPLRDGWRVRFLDRRESAPVVLPHDWLLERQGYAGSTEYVCEFDAQALWPGGVPERVVLDLGDAVPLHDDAAAERGLRGASYRTEAETPLGDVATVEMNGRPCGVLYAPPYEADVTDALLAGTNILRIVIANSTAAALTDRATRRAIDDVVARSRELYGARFRMQDLDAAADGLRSGLLSVPALRWAGGA